MSHQDARISRSIHTFGGQINAINSRLQSISPDWGSVPRYQYLGVDPAKAAEIQARVNNWNTNIYSAYTNPLTKHTVDGAGGTVETFITQFRELAGPVLDDIASNDKADHYDELAFNIVLTRNRKDPSKLTQNIEAVCSLSANHHGRGAFHCRVRKPEDGVGRANIPHEDGADSVELAYYIMPRDFNPDITPLPNLQQQAVQPTWIANPDALRTKERFTRAIFDFHVGAEHTGQWIQIFPRWFNSHYPQFAGAWGEMILMMIP